MKTCAMADELRPARPFGQTRVFEVPVSPANASAGQKGGGSGGNARSRKYPCEASFLDVGLNRLMISSGGDGRQWVLRAAGRMVGAAEEFSELSGDYHQKRHSTRQIVAVSR